MVHTNRKVIPLEGGNYQKIGWMWTLKHGISYSKLFEILVKTVLKGDTNNYLKDFYNHINICLNALTRLKYNLISTYHKIKQHSDFHEHFVPDRSHPY